MISKIIDEAVQSFGCTLISVNMQSDKTISVIINKDNAVTLSDCEKISRHLNYLLTVNEIEYERLEVSSPGINEEVN